MSAALGKDQVAIGSAPDNDVVIATAGVAPHHARLVRQGGQLFFVDLGAGASTANNAPVQPQQPVPFDFRTVFTVGGVPVPLAHAAICTMVMSPGQIQAQRGQVVVGRDGARASLVIAHNAVSGQHATVMLDRMMAVDHGSTSGTWVGGRQLPPNQPTPIDPNGVIAFGPVVVPVAVLVAVAHGAMSGVAPSPGMKGPTMGQPVHGPPPSHGGAPASYPQTPAPGPVGAPTAQAMAAPGGQPPRKHRTVIGELKLDDMSTNAISIGRTPDNQIVVNHPQVSSRHAQIVKNGMQLFLEDRGSANGTYVRGQRLPPGQRVPVSNGEKVFIGPMPLLIHIAESRVNVVVEDQADWAGKPLYEIEAWDLLPRGAGPRRTRPQRRSCSTTCHLQGAPRRPDRAHGPVGRGQDDAPARRSTATSADDGRGPRQRREPLRDLRRPAREHRLRPAGRHRPPRAHRLRGHQVLGAVPPPARLQRRRDRPPRRRR